MKDIQRNELYRGRDQTVHVRIFNLFLNFTIKRSEVCFQVSEKNLRILSQNIVSHVAQRVVLDVLYRAFLTSPKRPQSCLSLCYRLLQECALYKAVQTASAPTHSAHFLELCRHQRSALRVPAAQTQCGSKRHGRFDVKNPPSERKRKISIEFHLKNHLYFDNPRAFNLSDNYRPHRHYSSFL